MAHIVDKDGKEKLVDVINILPSKAREILEKNCHNPDTTLASQREWGLIKIESPRREGDKPVLTIASRDGKKLRVVQLISERVEYELLRSEDKENNQSAGDEEPEYNEPEYNEPPQHYGEFDLDKLAKDVSPDWWDN